MHLVKRSLTVLPLALIAVSLMAPSAMASEAPITPACTFTGLVGTLTPPWRFLPQTGGNGDFRFGGTASCVVTHGKHGAIPVAATIDAAGRYVNTACGTGTLEGDADLVFAPNPVGIRHATAHFKLTHAAGVGVLQILAYADNLGHQGQGGGEAVIVPAQGSCSAPPGVSQFTLAGAFTVVGLD